MPKKGKGSKLARMSDEERARYLQHRAELELETKRRKQQLIASFTKNKLKREEAFSRLNAAKIDEQWRFILRRIKCKELHEDVEYLWKNFDRTLKMKDLVIKRLYGQLDTADTDHRRLQEAHMHMIDLILGEYKQRSMQLHDSFARERDRIASNEMSDLKKTRETLRQYCAKLQDIIVGQDEEVEKKLIETKLRNAVHIQNVVYLKEDSLSRLMQYASNEAERLWQQINETISEYENRTEDKRKQYEYLKEQDKAHRDGTAQYPKLQMQLQSAIKNLKQDTCVLSQKREQSVTKLKDQIAHMRKTAENLRHALSTTQMLDTTSLKKLTIISGGVLKELQRMSEKASVVLSLLKMCSSLEPFSLIVRKYTLRDVESNTLTSRMSETLDKLEKFWEQFNHVKADNISMKRKCNKLSFENKQLKNTLRTYLLTAVSRTSTVRPLTSVFLYK